MNNPIIGIIIKRGKHIVFQWKRFSIEYLLTSLVSEKVRESGMDPMMGSITTDKGTAYKAIAYDKHSHGYVIERK